MFSYSPKERYMIDKEYYKSIREKRYRLLFPILLLLFSFIFYVPLHYSEEHILTIELIVIFNIIFLFIPLSFIPLLEKIFSLKDNDDKGVLLFMIYIFVLLLQMFLINTKNLPEQYKAILFAVISGLYGAIITRYLMYPLEIIEKYLGIKKDESKR